MLWKDHKKMIRRDLPSSERFHPELLKMGQITIIYNHCILWGMELLPESLDQKILFLYTTISEIQTGLTNMWVSFAWVFFSYILKCVRYDLWKLHPYAVISYVNNNHIV